MTLNPSYQTGRIGVDRQHWRELIQVTCVLYNVDAALVEKYFGEYVMLALIADRPIERIQMVLVQLMGLSVEYGYDASVVKEATRLVTPKNPV